MNTLNEMLKLKSPKEVHSELNDMYNEVLKNKSVYLSNAITKHEWKEIYKKYTRQLKNIESLYVELNKKFCNLY